jgi:hypothetical protein
LRNLGIASFTLLLVAIMAPSAAAFTITTSSATSDASGITHTFAATNEDDDPLITIRITVFDVFSEPLGDIVAQFVAEGVLTAAPGTPVAGSFILSGYVDPANSFEIDPPFGGAAVLVGTADESTVPFVGPLVPFTVPSPYRLILFAEVTLGPGESTSFTHSVSVSAVPEPATAMLLALGMLTVAFRSRRRR